jgi:predicted transcriptional regulator
VIAVFALQQPLAPSPLLAQYCIAIAMHPEQIMKTTAIPAVRVSPALREAAEALLREGETLSAFVEDAVRRNVELRQAQKAFVERGLESAVRARKSGSYVSAATVMGKLTRRLERARRKRSPEA